MVRSNLDQLGESTWISIPCYMCTNECGLKVHVENGRITGVKGWSDHLSQGKICVKARQIPEFVYHDLRIKYPMRREKRKNDKWERISWQEALDTIATKIGEGKERYGAASLGVLVGEPVCVMWHMGWFLIWRFCDVYGTPNRFDAGDLCGCPVFLGTQASLGCVTDFAYAFPDINNTNCVMVWANNPHASQHVIASQILTAKKRGAKLIVIDPRRIPLAKQADMHIRPRPGTDGILALAMINVIISEDLYDREFCDNWTVGFDRLAEHVKQYTPEKAGLVSGVAVEDIKKIARIFATTKPACIQSFFRLNFLRDGFQIGRSMNILSAITGNIDVPGGTLRLFPLPLINKPVRLPELMGDVKRTGEDKYPVYGKFWPALKEGSMVNWGDLVLAEPQQLRTMIISGANPAVTWPNSAKVRKALDKLDFLVVMDVVMTETAKRADMVLPASTFLERLSPCGWRGWYLRRPVIEPQWESWSDCKFWCELGRRMGYEEYFPWKADEETFDYFSEPLTVKKIFDEHPDGFIGPLTLPGEQQYKKEGFPTPSGKVELYSEQLKNMGYDPLPTYLEPAESPISTPELFREFPLILNAGHRELEWYHSEYRHLDALRRRNPGPVAEIHPESAMKYGIFDGEPMIIETRTGSLEINARVTEDIMPGMVSVPHAWEEAPENMLTDDTPVDPVTGFAAMTALLCKVRRKT